MVISLSFVVYVICVNLYVIPFCEIVWVSEIKTPCGHPETGVFSFFYTYTKRNYAYKFTVLDTAHDAI